MKGLTFPANGSIYWDGLPALGPPLTFGGWCKPRVMPQAATSSAFCLTTPAGTATTNYLVIGHDTSSRITFRAANATSQTSRSLGNVNTGAAGQWQLLVCVWFSDTDCRAYDLLRDPSSTDLGTLDMSGVTFTRFALGDRDNAGSLKWYYDGDIAEPFVYKRALTRPEMLLFNEGHSPMDVWPSDLVFHVPNLGNYVSGAPKNWYGGQAVSLSDTAPTQSTADIPLVNFPEFA